MYNTFIIVLLIAHSYHIWEKDSVLAIRELTAGLGDKTVSKACRGAGRERKEQGFVPMFLFQE